MPLRAYISSSAVLLVEFKLPPDSLPVIWVPKSALGHFDALQPVLGSLELEPEFEPELELELLQELKDLVTSFTS